MIVVTARKISPGPQPQPPPGTTNADGWLVVVEDTSTPNGKRAFECHWTELDVHAISTPRIPLALYVYDPNDDGRGGRGRRLVGLINADVVSYAEQLP